MTTITRYLNEGYAINNVMGSFVDVYYGDRCDSVTGLYVGEWNHGGGPVGLIDYVIFKYDFNYNSVYDVWRDILNNQELEHCWLVLKSDAEFIRVIYEDFTFSPLVYPVNGIASIDIGGKPNILEFFAYKYGGYDAPDGYYTDIYAYYLDHTDGLSGFWTDYRNCTE